MKKNFEYKEPEFKVVITNAQDVLTASSGGGVDPTPTGSLGRTDNNWNTPMIGI